MFRPRIEREREKEKNMCMCIYIYICISLSLSYQSKKETSNRRQEKFVATSTLQNKGNWGTVYVLPATFKSIGTTGQWVTQPCGQETHHHDARINFMALYESLGHGKNLRSICPICINLIVLRCSSVLGSPNWKRQSMVRFCGSKMFQGFF